jgi:hypothetical protein
VKRKAKTGKCATENCPYSGKLTKAGLCLNCASWIRRWSRASSSHWANFVGAYRLRSTRITQFGRSIREQKGAA